MTPAVRLHLWKAQRHTHTPGTLNTLHLPTHSLIHTRDLCLKRAISSSLRGGKDRQTSSEAIREVSFGFHRSRLHRWKSFRLLPYTRVFFLLLQQCHHRNQDCTRDQLFLTAEKKKASSPQQKHRDDNRVKKRHGGVRETYTEDFFTHREKGIEKKSASIPHTSSPPCPTHAAESAQPTCAPRATRGLPR